MNSRLDGQAHRLTKDEPDPPATDVQILQHLIASGATLENLLEELAQRLTLLEYGKADQRN